MSIIFLQKKDLLENSSAKAHTQVQLLRLLTAQEALPEMRSSCKKIPIPINIYSLKSDVQVDLSSNLGNEMGPWYRRHVSSDYAYKKDDSQIVYVWADCICLTPKDLPVAMVTQYYSSIDW